jgi:RimJ/RimL family protein N-acetyltransferase
VDDGQAIDAQPFDGDPSWRASRVLSDGTKVTLRPVAPEDREELRRAYRETSLETRYLRFLGFMGELSDDALTYLTDVDQKQHVAIAAFVASPDLKGERGVGVARFIRAAPHARSAEAAITVVDAYQRRGLGTMLAVELARAARARGLHALRAEVLTGNRTMRGILDAAGATPLSPEEDSAAGAGTIGYDVSLDPPGLAERLVHVLRGAARAPRAEPVWADAADAKEKRHP